MTISPKVSIAVPIHDTPNTAFFLSRLLKSLANQTYKDYEIVITKEGAMAKNHNAAIKQSKGEIIKLMQMDDYFAYSGALQEIVDHFTADTHWMISACAHTKDGVNTFGVHYPKWSENMHWGDNTLGGFSTLTMRKEGRLLLNEDLTWVVDCELYLRYKQKYGEPTLLNSISVIVDVGEHRLSSTLSEELKRGEVISLANQYK